MGKNPWIVENWYYGDGDGGYITGRTRYRSERAAKKAAQSLSMMRRHHFRQKVYREQS